MEGNLDAEAMPYGSEYYSSLEQFESLLLANDLDALAQKCAIFCRAQGFQNYLYGAHIRKPNGEFFQYIFSNYPDGWIEKYLSSGYVDIDPIVEHCCCSQKSIPLVWSEQIFDTAVRKAFMEDAKKHGISDGLSVPIRGAQNEQALFSVANPVNTQNRTAHHAQSIGTLYLFSSYLHEALRSLVFAKEMLDTQQPNLTSRETECLLWWANGKSVNEISQLIGTTPRTVRFHLDNVKAKLGVETKSQAIAQAYKLGMITP